MLLGKGGVRDRNRCAELKLPANLQGALAYLVEALCMNFCLVIQPRFLPDSDLFPVLLVPGKVSTVV